MDNFKTVAGRLREAGAQEIIRLRSQARPPTYHQIANIMGVSVGTVYNVVKKRTWAFLGGVPSESWAPDT